MRRENYPTHAAVELLLPFLIGTSDSPMLPRSVIIVAHPDDEVLGMSSRLPLLAGRTVVAYASDGAPQNPAFWQGAPTREAHALLRHEEALAALALAGIGQSDVREFCAVDQELGLSLVKTSLALLELLLDFQPLALFTHAYEGGHPDHDACAFTAHVACELSRRAGRAVPMLIEFPSYHSREGALVFGEFIRGSAPDSLTLELTGGERARKLAMLRCHRSQEEVWSRFPIAYERFRAAPAYDFTNPPAAPFHYDRVDFKIKGGQLLELMRTALEQLTIEGPC